MKAHGPWQIVDSREVYRDPWLDVRLDNVIRPDRKPGTHSVVSIKPGVCVLALDDEQVYLTEEFHYAVGRTTIECVSGGIESGETALEAAKRELQQELGIIAKRWTDLGTVDPFTSSVVSPTQLFLAQGLTIGEPDLEGTEQIRCVTMPLAEAVQKVCSSDITHGPSCVLILKVAMRNSADCC